MKINFAKLVSGVKEEIVFNEKLDNLLIDDINIIYPIHVKGTLKIDGKTLLIRFNTNFSVILICSRCLEPFNFEISHNFNDKFDIESFEDISNDEIILDTLIKECIYLDIPFKPLCDKDCKGICIVCGENKNKYQCNCKIDDIDPRLSMLKSLLKEDE